MIVPLMLAGGSGTRLWPLSRSTYPKQLLSLGGEQSLLQQTALRTANLATVKPITVCNEVHRFIVAEQLQEVDQLGPIILEPEGRNTAPAIALATLQAIKEDPDAVVVVLPADHLVKYQGTFERAVEKAIKVAQIGKLVTFGVEPSHAEIGYGYIKRGKELPTEDPVGDVFQIDQFVEKPSLEVAQKYLRNGSYYWNSGMFAFKAARYLAELEKYAPLILEACEAATKSAKLDLDFIRVDAQRFKACPSDSIDYAVMEKTDCAAVIPMDAGWSDIGSFSALWDQSEKDVQGNSVQGDVVVEDTVNSLVWSEDCLVATLGIKDLVVVQTKDAVLVAHKEKVQSIKTIVDELKSQGREEHLFHQVVYRPWGHYQAIDVGERYQVKRITVKAGGKLSVQMHHHRAEHWVVVSGAALVSIDGKEQLLSENESVYIPIGAVHSLQNPGKIPLELIEVQSGSYLGEDDIVRLEDHYGRD